MCVAKRYLSVRLDETALERLHQLADGDSRTDSWMGAQLILEALKARGLLPETFQQLDSRSAPRQQQ
jgi:predicted transcriptional regulator